MGKTHGGTLAFQHMKHNDVVNAGAAPLSMQAIARELRKESKAGEITHAIEIHFPVEVIPFVLNHSGMEIITAKIPLRFRFDPAPARECFCNAALCRADSGMLKHPSQSSSVSSDNGVICGLIKTVKGTGGFSG